MPHLEKALEMFYSAARRASQLTNTFTVMAKFNKLSELTASEKRALSDKIMFVMKVTHIEKLDSDPTDVILLPL